MVNRNYFYVFICWIVVDRQVDALDISVRGTRGHLVFAGRRISVRMTSYSVVSRPRREYE